MHYENTPAHAFAVRTRFAYALALALAFFAAFALTFAMTASAYAEESAVRNKAEVYFEESVVEDGDLKLLSGLTPLYGLSEEIRYFAIEESGWNYDQGFSYGDYYHAMGFYQFDHRFGLQSFLIDCYEYDPVTYRMFEQFVDIPAEDFEYYANEDTWTEPSESAIRTYNDEAEKWEYTELGNALNDAWHAAYEANSEEFSALQDAWSYNSYYRPARSYLISKGISIDNRADCVKGLCWGMCNLFGSGGWRKYVTGSEVNDDMTDEQFVTNLCDYLIGHVKEDYGFGSYYEKRYEREKLICLEYLADDEDQVGEDDEPEIVMGDKAYSYASDVVAGSWYVQSYEYVMSHGIMNGNDDGTFAPGRDLKREEAAAVLYNYLGNGEMVPPTDHRDVPPGRWYSEAVSWCVAKGYMTGYAGTDKFGVGKYLTRQELACIVARVANANLSLANASKYNSLGDNGKTSSWARDSLVWAVDKGIINGKDAADGSKLLAPKDNVTRAQIAAIMMNSISRGIM